MNISVERRRPQWRCQRPTGLYLTLPLTPSFLNNRPALRQSIQRTRSRWSWFESGQRQNPSLGTLSHLPPEIRSLIWKQLAGNDSWQDLIFYSDWWWPTLHYYTFHYYSMDIFPGSPHYERYPAPLWECGVQWTIKNIPRRLPLRYLRKALPLVGLEFDEIYLSTTALAFSTSYEATRILDQYITPWHYPCIRHLSLTLDSDDNGWIPLFQHDLPPNLATVTLDLAHGNHRKQYERYQDFVVALYCEGEYCSVGKQKRSGTGRPCTCKHHHRSRFLAKKLERDVELLETVVMVLRRTCPAASIRLGKGNGDCKLCHDRCRKVVGAAA
ncbi:MAG: hypothetical protein Q9219_003568 [cf. Caloplaca sp. 3 TL-2023]